MEDYQNLGYFRSANPARMPLKADSAIDGPNRQNLQLVPAKNKILLFWSNSFDRVNTMKSLVIIYIKTITYNFICTVQLLRLWRNCSFQH